MVAKHLNEEGYIITAYVTDHIKRVKLCMVKVYYDKEMDTLDIWFDDPPEEGFSREMGDGIILKYDVSGKIVGVEILFLSKQKKLPDEIKNRVGKIVEEFVNAVKAIA